MRGRPPVPAAEQRATGLDYRPGPVAVLHARAFNGFFEADHGEVRAAATEGVRLARQSGDLYGLEIMLLNLGSAALFSGDLDEAQPLLTEALQLAYRLDDRVAIFYLLDAFGCRAALSGQAPLAAQLFGAASRIRSDAGANVMPFLTPLLSEAEEKAATALGATRFATEFAAGQRLSRDAALDLALGKATASGGVNAARPGATVNAGPLGAREGEVAGLVAVGLTNKQIGTRLFISERTVDSHVRSIMNKLGVNSRAQIAAWMASPSD